MNDKLINKEIRRRVNPKLWQWDYLALDPIKDSLIKFSHRAQKEGVKSILDMGCGVKPYESLFPFVDKFVGFDIVKNERVDIVGNNWNLPFRDGEFDALIATQVLEHTAKTAETISEIKKAVRNNGLIFISAPLTFPEHGIPKDYYRFTKFGLMEIFKDFEILEIKPLNGFLNTMFRLLNTFVRNISASDILLSPVYFINNCLAILSDKAAYIISRSRIKYLRKIYDDIYMNMTENYVVIIRNKK